MLLLLLHPFNDFFFSNLDCNSLVMTCNVLCRLASTDYILALLLVDCILAISDYDDSLKYRQVFPFPEPDQQELVYLTAKVSHSLEGSSYVICKGSSP